MENKKPVRQTPDKVDFDKYAGRYENVLGKQLDFFGEENSYFAEYKVKIVKDTLNSFKPLNILEFGCGIGRNLKFFTKYFPDSDIYGCDISAGSIGIAKNENPDLKIFLLNGEEEKKHYDKFDLVFISCVFHHIAPAERKDAMNNIYKMMKNKATAIIFEHNPYNPITRHIVNTCEWDTDAILLSMKESVDLMEDSGLDVTEKNYTLFFPAVLGFMRPVENLLKKVPIGGQYYVRGIKK